MIDNSNSSSSSSSLNSSLRNDPNLNSLIDAFMKSVEEEGLEINDPIEAAKYLSNMLGSVVNIPSVASDTDKLFLQLIEESESDVQDSLQVDWLSKNTDFNRNSFVMDTHSSNNKAPIFMLPGRLCSKNGSVNSGKPDFTSLIAPVFLEIKDVESDSTAEDAKKN